MKIIKNFSIEGKHQKPIVTDVFYNETHQPKKVVIFCHGYKGFKDWGAWNLMAEAFANAGFFFIKFNFSHNGGCPCWWYDTYAKGHRRSYKILR